MVSQQPSGCCMCSIVLDTDMRRERTCEMKRARLAAEVGLSNSCSRLSAPNTATRVRSGFCMGSGLGFRGFFEALIAVPVITWVQTEPVPDTCTRRGWLCASLQAGTLLEGLQTGHREVSLSGAESLTSSQDPYAGSVGCQGTVVLPASSLASL